MATGDRQRGASLSHPGCKPGRQTARGQEHGQHLADIVTAEALEFVPRHVHERSGKVRRGQAVNFVTYLMSAARDFVRNGTSSVATTWLPLTFRKISFVTNESASRGSGSPANRSRAVSQKPKNGQVAPIIGTRIAGLQIRTPEGNYSNHALRHLRSLFL